MPLIDPPGEFYLLLAVTAVNVIGWMVTLIVMKKYLEAIDYIQDQKTYQERTSRERVVPNLGFPGDIVVPEPEPRPRHFAGRV